MTWWHEHPEAAKIASKNWGKSDLLVYAQREPCIKVQRDELANINRVVVALGPGQLRNFRPRHSWMAAILICKGDNTEELADIVQDGGHDPARFHFYLHKDADRSALKAWAAAGLPLDRVDEGIKDWKSLHKLLGIDFNVQVVDDAVRTAKP